MEASRLSKEDQARVDHYLQASQRRDQSREFRPWRLLMVIWLVMLLMSGASYAIARLYGVV